MPVRKIPKNYRNVTGVAPHKKSIGAAQFESTLERDFLTLLEFSPEVEAFEVQPVTIEWSDENSKRRRYTPDVLVFFAPGSTYGSKPAICEIKYTSDLRKDWLTLKPKFIAAREYSHEKNQVFRIVTDKDIRTTYLKNAKFLLPYTKRPPVEEHMDLLDSNLEKLGKSTPGELVETIFNDEWNIAWLIPTLWYLIGTFQVGIDLNHPLRMDSPIWWVE